MVSMGQFWFLLKQIGKGQVMYNLPTPAIENINKFFARNEHDSYREKLDKNLIRDKHLASFPEW